jgi:hypothetical protein
MKANREGWDSGAGPVGGRLSLAKRDFRAPGEESRDSGGWEDARSSRSSGAKSLRMSKDDPVRGSSPAEGAGDGRPSRASSHRRDSAIRTRAIFN